MYLDPFEAYFRCATDDPPFRGKQSVPTKFYKTGRITKFRSI